MAEDSSKPASVLDRIASAIGTALTNATAYRTVAAVEALRDDGKVSLTVDARPRAGRRHVMQVRVTDAAGRVLRELDKAVPGGRLSLTLSDLGLIPAKRGGLAVASIDPALAGPAPVRLELRSGALHW